MAMSGPTPLRNLIEELDRLRSSRFCGIMGLAAEKSAVAALETRP
jgi:hypothetical protein